MLGLWASDRSQSFLVMNISGWALPRTLSAGTKPYLKEVLYMSDKTGDNFQAKSFQILLGTLSEGLCRSCLRPQEIRFGPLG